MRFREVTEAYEVLSSSERRALYDRYGHAGLRSGGFTPTHFDVGGLSDLFAAFFGDDVFGGGRAAPRNSAGRTSVRRSRSSSSTRRARATVEVPFEVAVAVQGLRRRRRRAGHAAARPARAARGAAGCTRSRAACSASSSARRRARSAAAAARSSSIRARSARAPGASSSRATLDVDDPGRHPRRPAHPRLGRRARRRARRPRRRRLRARARQARSALRARGQRHLLAGRPDDRRGGARRDDARSRRSTARSSSSCRRASQPGEVRVLRGKGMPVLQGFGRGDHRVLVNVSVPRRVSRRAAPPARGVRRGERRAHLPPRRGLLREAEERVPLSGPAQSRGRGRRRAARGGPRDDARALPRGLRGGRPSRRRRRARGVHRRGGRGAPLALLRRRARRPTSRPAGRTAGARSTGRSRSARSGSARPGRRRPAARSRSSSIRAARSARARTRRRSSACASCRTLERGSLLDVGCGSGVLSIAAALLGFAPVVGVDIEEPSIEATRENARANGVEVEARLVGGRRARCRRRRSRSRTSRSPRCEALPRPPRRRDARHVGLPRLGAARARRLPRTSTGTRSRAGPPTCTCARKRQYDSAMATFRVDFLGCKVSHADVHEVREALLARRARRARRDADVAVISTCCVTNEARREEPQGGGARRANARARLRHRLRREPAGRRVRRAARRT